ncbi:MAG: hypothetical protein QOG54_1082 [Actinomycetota bacterium]|jgi:uncharacterized protein with GYD domain|nr:hypothetical protein [Actinomycetota bacterium]
MPKYMWKVAYSQSGLKGVLKEGGTGRREAIEKLAANLGGQIESFYYAFGEDDAYIIADFPSDVDVAAVSMNVGAVGAARVQTIPLLSPEEIDQAAKRSIEYRPPGA